MTIYNKRYEASFYQLPVIEDSLALAEELISLMLTKYTEEQLANPTEDIQSDIVNSSVSLFIEKCSNKSVWFMIDRQYNDYYLLLPVGGIKKLAKCIRKSCIYRRFLVT